MTLTRAKNRCRLLAEDRTLDIDGGAGDVVAGRHHGGGKSLMRRSELTVLTLADVEEKPTRLLITVRRSKPDQEGHGQTVESPAANCHPQLGL